ncbi:hypothetical protein Tco_0139694 [Tanacetum coccineum]
MLSLSGAQILWGMFHQKKVDYVELLWEDFIYQIENRVYKKKENMYYPRFTKVIIHHFLIQEKRNSLGETKFGGSHHLKDDYLINSLRFVSAKESSQIYGVVLPECLTSPEMKESKAYKTYLGHATGVVTSQGLLRKFKKASPTENRIVILVSCAENPLSVEKITPTVTSEGTGDKPGVPDVTEDDSTESEFGSWGNDEDDNNNKQKASDEGSRKVVQENKSEDDEIESDEDKGMDDTTDQFDNDVDARLEEPTQTESLTARIKEQVKDQLPHILPKEVSNFAPPVFKKLIKELRDEVTLAKVSSQPQSTYEADLYTYCIWSFKDDSSDKMEKSKSYLTAPQHRDCYDGLKKSYTLDKDFFFSYDVYSLKRGQKDKDKDEDPFARSNRGLKKRKLSKDAEPTTKPKKKYSTSGSSKGTKSQPKSYENETKERIESAPLEYSGSRNLNQTSRNSNGTMTGNIGKTTQEGPTQNWLMTLAASTSTDKSLKDFDELMSTPIDFSGYILNGLKIERILL